MKNYNYLLQFKLIFHLLNQIDHQIMQILLLLFNYIKLLFIMV